MDKEGRCIIEKEAEHMKAHGSLGKGMAEQNESCDRSPLK